MFMTDPRIGKLVREGRTIYYAWIEGEYWERYTLADIEMVLGLHDEDDYHKEQQ